MLNLLIMILLLIISIEIGVVIHMIQKSLMSYNFLSQGIDSIKNDLKKHGHVTDPFEVANRKQSIGSSSHIILRKPADQIRNENYDKIKEGKTYGFDN